MADEPNTHPEELPEDETTGIDTDTPTIEAGDDASIDSLTMLKSGWREVWQVPALLWALGCSCSEWRSRSRHRLSRT